MSCIGNPIWQIPIEEVEKMKIHYEWWAKAGGGPGIFQIYQKKNILKILIGFLIGWKDIFLIRSQIL